MSRSTVVRNLLRIVIFGLSLLLCVACNPAYLPPLDNNPWQVIQLPTDMTPQDISFTGDPQHGWLVGSKTSLFETVDGGQTWQERRLDLDEKFTFTSVSFAGNEGWIVGEPSILLHTGDGGQSWTQISLSSRLPGSPSKIQALGPGKAEMTTDVGAIYQTTDGGQTWQALVQEAVGVFRNLARSPDGRYIAVSSRGSFYSMWEPGQQRWQPYNRSSSRRVQNMGFTQDGGLWLLARGGQIQFSPTGEEGSWTDPLTPEFATSWGLLDLAYRTPEELWIVGGSGNLLCSQDGGKTWKKDTAVEDVPSNFNRILFMNANQGFILGQRGIILRYQAA
nr:photosynthesis system II assembly factor Ycf48 [Trichothermofontia sichuanensis]